MTRERKYRYRSGSTLVLVITVILVALMLLHGMSIISSYLQIRLLEDIREGVEVPGERVDANDLRRLLIGVARTVLYLASVVPVAMWLFRANQNARALGARWMVFTSGWTVGWFFVPIMNLFRPYQAVKEIWLASANPTSPTWSQQSRPILVDLWWAGTIVSWVLSIAWDQWEGDAETVDALLPVTRMEIACDGVAFLATLAALAVFRGLYKLQKRNAPEQPFVW